MALQNYGKYSIKMFLSNNIYHIPEYQREYTWEEPEVGDFWDDLEYTKKHKDQVSHFFGQIVVHDDENEGKKYIIDGQQRTITSVIFLRVLYIYYDKIYLATHNVEAMERMGQITGYIGSCTAKKNTLRLILNNLDREYFKEKIQLGRPTDEKEKKKSHERIRKTFVFFDNKLQQILDEHTGSDEDELIECLNEYCDTFVERFEVFYIEATELEEAFVIFETLNARGKELETADLLKNYLFRQSKDVKLAQEKWDSMIKLLDKADPTKYIRHFWNSNHKFQRDKTLYRAISKNVKTPKSSKELLKDLEQCAQFYHAMAFPGEDAAFQNDDLVNSLKALNTLKARSFYPVVLAMKQSGFKEDDIASVVTTIESYMFRNFTICGKVANESERFFASTAKNISDEELVSASDICDCIKEEMVTDDEFLTAFSIWSASKSEKNTVRYILTKIHMYIEPDSEINLDTSVVHIEHIMPENFAQWQVDSKIHDTYLWRLGNLMLLKGKLNISASNRSFDEKKTKYLDSKIEPNKKYAIMLHGAVMKSLPARRN